MLENRAISDIKQLCLSVVTDDEQYGADAEKVNLAKSILWLINPDFIEFRDGPLSGMMHEVHEGMPVPNKLAIRDANGQHWYQVDHQSHSATYIETKDTP